MLNAQKGIKKSTLDSNNLDLEINRITRILKKAGLNEINGPSKSEFRAQLRFQF